MAKHRILVVFAEDDIRNMLNMYFSNLGYDVTTVETSEDAIELIQSSLQI